MLSVLFISPSILVNGCSFMWDVRAGKPIECSVYIKSHSFHDYKPQSLGFDCCPSSIICPQELLVHSRVTPANIPSNHFVQAE